MINRTAAKGKRPTPRLELSLLMVASAVALLCCDGSETSGPSFPEAEASGRFSTEVVTTLPNFPVAMTFTSPDRILLTEKGGFGGVGSASVRVVEGGRLLDPPLITFEGVQTRAEMGLLGIALDPDYGSNRVVYAYYTHAASGRNRIVRFQDGRSGQRDSEASLVIDDLPADVCGNHQGGTIAFGPDRMLYVSVGDNGCNSCNSQSGLTLAGKILRFTGEGGIPADNPFASSPFPASAFYATGLRNSFDFTFHPATGEIFATENGPDANDEVNRIRPGLNYGWPYFQCEESFEPPCPFDRPTHTAPLRCYRSVIAPTGIAFYTGTVYPQAYRGNLFFGDYNTGSLRRLVLAGSGASVESADDEFLTGQGPIVDVVDAPDGRLYLLTERDIRRVAFVEER